MKTIDANTIINREKLSPLQWMVFILGFFVFFCDGLDTGIIGFIGLVVPHLVRMILGPDHKRLLPMSALLGAALLALADIGARAFLPPAELPVGLVTALIGAPFFIFLLLQQRSKLI